MNSREEKDQLSRSYPRGHLESPFLAEELFVGEGEPEWEARLAALQRESPFERAFEEGISPIDEGRQSKDDYAADESHSFESENGLPLDAISLSELKAVRITSTFETGRAGDFGGLTGNFDGQGVSFGLMNFAWKAGSLVTLLKEFLRDHQAAFAEVFGADAERFQDILLATKPDPKNPKLRVRDLDRQMEFARNVLNDAKNKIREPWRTYFRRLETNSEFRHIQVKAVRKAAERARYWCEYFGLKTERAFAFMFDLVSSHGGAWLNAPKFKGQRRKLLHAMLEKKKTEVGRADLTERQKLEVIANMIADVSSERWREKVRVRKLWFVKGSGKVHGSFWDLAKDFGVTDAPLDFGNEPGLKEIQEEQETPALPNPGDNKFTLSEWKLALREIVIARARDKKKGTTVAITEAPAVFLPEIISMARDRAAKDQKNDLADKLDPAMWFKRFTQITFLGRRPKPKQYLHLEMAKLLKQIESELVKKYDGDARSVGDMLLNKSPEGISGSRLVSSTATFSMHMFGLAVDVNYLGNPYIQSQDDIKALNNVLRSAALLMNRPILSYQKGYAKNKFDSVKQLDSMLETYFSLLDKPVELAQFVQASTSSEWRGLSAVETRKKIQGNLDNLAKYLVRVGPLPCVSVGTLRCDNNYLLEVWGAVDKKDYFKKHAILDFDKRFVEAMENRGLYWGGHYGDMMHFDMRGTGVGYYIEKARLDYAGKAKEIAEQLCKEKRYGKHSLRELKPRQGLGLEYGIYESSPSRGDENFVKSAKEFGNGFHSNENNAEEEEFFDGFTEGESRMDGFPEDNSSELGLDNQEEEEYSELEDEDFSDEAFAEESDGELEFADEWETDDQYQDKMGLEAAKYFELEAPPLLKNPNKSDPLGQTLYLQISLGKYKYEHCVQWEKLTKDQKNKGVKTKCLKTGLFGIPPMTGIFIPENYAPRSKVDIILYLHGHKSSIPGSNVPIAQYWDGQKYPIFALREEVNASKKNVILVVPTLGLKSEPGNLVIRRNGLDEYLDKVLEALKTYGPYQGQSPTIGNLILAAHSGGGTYMRQLALSSNRFASKIKECWGFDCMYSGDKDVDGWLSWAKKNSSATLYSYYWRGSPASASKKLQHKADEEKLLNVTTKLHDSEDKRSHFLLVMPSFRERLQNIQFLVITTGNVHEVNEYLLKDQENEFSFADEFYAEEDELFREDLVNSYNSEGLS